MEEKYYINNEKAQKLIDTLIENGTLEGDKQGSYLNYKKVAKTSVNVAKTLCARDYKGVGSQYVSEGKVIVQRFK